MPAELATHDVIALAGIGRSALTMRGSNGILPVRQGPPTRTTQRLRGPWHPKEVFLIRLALALEQQFGMDVRVACDVVAAMPDCLPPAWQDVCESADLMLTVYGGMITDRVYGGAYRDNGWKPLAGTMSRISANREFSLARAFVTGPESNRPLVLLDLTHELWMLTVLAQSQDINIGDAADRKSWW